MSIQPDATGPRTTAVRRYAGKHENNREHGFEISGSEYRDILARYSNPKHVGTPAAKLNSLIRNEEVSSTLVRQWATEKSIDLVRNKHLTLTPALFVNVCKRTSIEALLHERYDLSVDLIRAASLYEKRRRAFTAEHGRLSDETERKLWTIAVQDEISRQQADWESGRRKTHPRWMPLADGTSSNPQSTSRMACGGYDAWQSFLHRVNPDRTVQPYHETPNGSSIEWSPSDGIDHTSTPVLDADWMASHGINRMSVLSTIPTTPRLKQLYLILGDMHFARLADQTARPGERARDILRRLGLSDRETRTGVRYEILMLRYPNADKVKAWNWACAHTGTHHASPGHAMHRRYLSHVADAVEHLIASAELARV